MSDRHAGLYRVLVAAALSSAAVAHADEGAAAIAASRCAACHGGEGLAPVVGVPNLAGQKRGYLLSQLQIFRDGTRRNTAMLGVFRGLDDAALAALATHYAGLPPRPAPAPAADTPGRSEAAICAPCHGVSGRSGNEEWPNLGGQRADYLRAQLAAYRSGERGNPIMARVARSLDPAREERLARYFEALAEPDRSGR